MLGTIAVVLLALTRSEIIERMKAPVVTQAEGLIQVYADCPEDMRKEFQLPIASFAANTVDFLYAGQKRKREHFRQSGIVIHIGEEHTNNTQVVTRVMTNDARVVTRIYLKAPGYSDLYQFKLEVIKGFFRAVMKEELNDDEAIDRYRKSDPRYRIEDERRRLEQWLDSGVGDDEEGLKLLRKVIEPGVASVRDVLTFAARLRLYPPQHDIKLPGCGQGAISLSFKEALGLCKRYPALRLIARMKADELPVFGGGRSAEMAEAAELYRAFLMELAANERSVEELAAMLDEAEVKLNIALENAKKKEGIQ